MARKTIIIDCDPGQDDAVMLLLAFGARDELDIKGITTVAGNVPLAKTQRNARIICELGGVTDIPVFAGCERPMMRHLVTAEEVHGGEGIDGTDIYEPDLALQTPHAVDYIVEALMAAADNSTTLVPTGPLTNIGMAIVREPRILPKIQEIVLMGGAMREGGNTTPAAEFNIYVDPHAAAVVFAAGIPITMMPLDVTHKALTTARRNEALRALGNRTGQAVAEMLGFFERFDEAKYGSDGGPLHDPCTIAWMLAPEIFSGRHCNVEIETASELTMGMTVIDWWQVTGRKHNAFVVGDLDADAFFELITTRLARLP